MLSRARSFFSERAIFEVDTFHLAKAPSIDTHIDLFSCVLSTHEKRYLLSSPEYPMKRLLAAGSPDIYQLAHVYRNEYSSNRHSPEFMMAEWYRKGIAFSEMIEETCLFCELFLGQTKRRYLSYAQAFKEILGIDPLSCTREELLEELNKQQIEIPSALDRDDLLSLLLTYCIEPTFDHKELTCLYHYPKSQAALATLVQTKEGKVAERFEIYCGGLELANGYHEDRLSAELRKRFLTSNENRKAMGKEEYPLDEAFLKANGDIPDCCGVAVGFDRLMMLHLKTETIEQAHPLPWNQA